MYPSYKFSHSKKSFFTGLLKNLFFKKHCISRFLICWLMWKGQQVSSSIFIRYTPFQCTNPQSLNCKLIRKACDSNFLKHTDVSPYNQSHFCACLKHVAIIITLQHLTCFSYAFQDSQRMGGELLHLRIITHHQVCQQDTSSTSMAHLSWVFIFNVQLIHICVMKVWCSYAFSLMF